MNQVIDIRNIKAPVDMPLNLAFIILLLLVICFLALLIFFLNKRRFRGLVFFVKSKRHVPKIIKMPWEIAYEKLEQLMREDLISKGQLKKYFTLLSDIIRVYFEQCYEIKAPEMTSEEFLQALRESRQLNESQRELIRDILFCSDMVKFAKYLPNQTEIEKSYHITKRLIDETKTQKQLELNKEEINPAKNS